LFHVSQVNIPILHQSPIVFQKGEFKISKIAYASLPALRVTAYGASAYARYYNRRLPTFTEWLHAMGNGDLQLEETLFDGGNSHEELNMQSMHGLMHSQAKSDISRPKSPGPKLSSVINDQPNKYGIRGLNKNIKEWGNKVSESTSIDNFSEAEFVVLPSTIQRYPWEGFGEVDFRCVQEIKIKAK
jgi:serine/threonine-protein kinase